MLPTGRAAAAEAGLDDAKPPAGGLNQPQISFQSSCSVWNFTWKGIHHIQATAAARPLKEGAGTTATDRMMANSLGPGDLSF